MPSLQDQDYVKATNEVTQGELDTAAWGRAFSAALGDRHAALALYIRFRVEQLGRDRRQQKVQEIWDGPLGGLAVLAGIGLAIYIVSLVANR